MEHLNETADIYKEGSAKGVYWHLLTASLQETKG